jgi:hypothetical protein
MKHNDYFKVLICPVCRKDIYSPKDWEGTGKIDGMWARHPTPRYATCQHKEAIKKYHKVSIQ